jgi:PTH1 family peptidyl-tRNA hydrolase
MYLLVGLGNIGREYELTRHNLGFLLLDQIVQDYGFFEQSKKFKSEVFFGEIDGKKVVAIKPQTFMNRSGNSVLEAASFFKIEPKNILVLHDDIDLELGKVRVKTGGGNAGHNGLRSIDDIIGKNYMRLRFGIGRPQNSEFAVSDYVLGKFSREEIEKVKRVNEKISDFVDEVLEGRFEIFYDKLNSNLA